MGWPRDLLKRLKQADIRPAIQAPTILCFPQHFNLLQGKLLIWTFNRSNFEKIKSFP